ncbi:cephalosporin hydroxylase [Arenimonas soli]|uniref:Cephalosporin hydroxylase n=1 Tax=Arenimonas soli TaxID=2269504 RepID=A0ABQ1HQQ8_9GAMM|nr:cephalosporin hydroxylase family protein [Arenimonas soli]GGA85057.1 cephalosporin hydroxylase [Arenimonas soli]
MSSKAHETPEARFASEVADNIRGLGQDQELQALSREWLLKTLPHRYSYNFSWMGRPIIQYPQDMVAMQEILWRVQPDLIVETGIAHGGSLVYYASLLELIGKGEVLGIDIDIRPHNRAAIEAHPMARRIAMLEGSSIDPGIVAEVGRRAAGRRTLVVLDSNHSHDHVLQELRAYAPLTSVGSYCVVFDTVVEDLPAGLYPDRPWDVGNNPKTAVAAYVAENPDFEVDQDVDAKTLISVAPGGYLRRVR